MEKDRIEQMLDRIEQRLDSIDVTLAKQHVSLQEHIRRTNIIEDALKPVILHVNYMHGLAKTIKIVALI